MGVGVDREGVSEGSGGEGDSKSEGIAGAIEGGGSELPAKDELLRHSRRRSRRGGDPGTTRGRYSSRAHPASAVCASGAPSLISLYRCQRIACVRSKFPVLQLHPQI